MKKLVTTTRWLCVKCGKQVGDDEAKCFACGSPYCVLEFDARYKEPPEVEAQESA